MKKNISLFYSLFFGTVLIFLSLNNGAAAFKKAKYHHPILNRELDCAEGEILIKYRPKKTTHLQRVEHRKKHAVDQIEKIVFSESEDQVVHLCHLQKGHEALEKTLEALRADPDVEFAEPNYIRKPMLWTPNDPFYTGFIADEYNGTAKTEHQWSDDKANVPAAWDLLAKNWGYADWSAVPTSKLPLIGIADDGIDVSHEDLKEADGTSIVVKQWDFNSNDSNAAPDSGDIGHGTHVAGICAARANNSKGIAGVSKSHLVIAKVLGPQGGTDANVAKGIQWCVDNGAKVVNLSLGGSGTSSTLSSAINYAYSHGVVVCAAAGNEFQSGNPVEYPGAYNHVIGVAATNSSDVRGSFSNTGSYVDIAAPGVDIISSIPKTLPKTDTGDSNGNGYTAWDGTSMATPFLTGVAALVIAAKPTATPDEVEQILESTAKDLGTAGRDNSYGWGRVVADAAVQKALGVAGGSSADGSGKASLTRTSVNTNTFYTSLTLTFTPTADLGGGQVSVTIPSGWTGPQTSNSSGNGYVSAWIYDSATAAKLTLTATVSGQSIVLSGIPADRLKNGGADSLKWNYKNFTSQSSAGTATFLVKSAGSGGTLTALVNGSPSLSVLSASGSTSADGSGKASLSRTSVLVNTFYTSITETVTPTADLGGGSVQVVIPTGWTAPQTSNSSGNGYVSAWIYNSVTAVKTFLTLTVSGQSATITGIASDRLKNGGTDSLKFNYKNLTTQSTAGTATFLTKTAGAGGTLTNLAAGSPTLAVQ